LDDIFEGAKEAGRQLVKDGVMASSTLQTISRELIDQKTYMERVNRTYVTGNYAYQSLIL